MNNQPTNHDRHPIAQSKNPLSSIADKIVNVPQVKMEQIPNALLGCSLGLLIRAGNMMNVVNRYMSSVTNPIQIKRGSEM